MRFIRKPKGSTIIQTISILLIISFVVGVLFYLWFEDRMNKFEDKIDELTVIREEDIAEKLNLKRPRVCLREYKVQLNEKEISFTQPCEWGNNIPFSDSLSASGTIVSPEGNASIHFPAPEIEVTGGDNDEEENKNTTVIKNIEYPTQGYHINGEMIMIIDMSRTFGPGVNLLIAYTDLSGTKALEEILMTMEF